MYIALVTHDIEYATRLISYIRYEKKHIPYSFQMFTSVDFFLHNAQRTLCQMVIIDEHLLPEYKLSKASLLNIPMIVVTESNLNLEEAIFKFRPASQAFNEIQKRLEHTHVNFRTTSNETQVVAVSSFLAGVGKTTVALALADELVRKGQHVFYFNLERWLSDDLYISISDEVATEANLSKLYYMMQTTPEQCKDWLKRVKFDLPGHSCYTLYPFVHQEDRMKLQADEALALLKVIKESKYFHTIIIDLEAGYDSVQTQLIGEADSHFICTHSSTRMQKKHMQEIEHLSKQLDKNIFTKLEHAIYMTQSHNQTTQHVTTHPNTIYIPHLEEGQVPSHSSLYRAAIMRAIQKIGQPMEFAVCH